MTDRWLRWMVAAVTAVGIISLTPVFGADVRPRPAHGEVPRSRAVAQQDGLGGAGKSFDSSAVEIFLAGNADANLPREALRRLASQYGVSHGEFAQASSRDEEEFDEEFPEYDPWERFNRVMFAFNQKLDRFVLKPV